jgi:predicted ATPase
MKMTSQFLRSIALAEVPEPESYPFSVPAVRGLAEKPLQFHGHCTFLIGENGSGKSTLIEAIAVAAGFNAEGGTANFQFATQESHSSLHNYLRLTRGTTRPKDGFFLRAESFYNVATQIDNLDKEPGGRRVSDSYGGKSLHTRSHGEAFLALMMHRFDPKGLYILDEPESALSPSRQMSMLALMHRLIKSGSQFIVATHSPIVMAYPDSQMYKLTESGIEKTTFHETEHYIVTKKFLNEPEEMLSLLLEDENV